MIDALRQVRQFIEAEVENRGAAGASMTDYQDEAKTALDLLDGVIAELQPPNQEPLKP